MPVSKTVSMTGFAARRGQGAGHSWAWDIRSVNGKGLDLRLRVNPPALSAVLKAMAEVEQTAMDAGLTLAPANAADVLAVRGVLDTSAAEIDTAPLRAAI